MSLQPQRHRTLSCRDGWEGRLRHLDAVEDSHGRACTPMYDMQVIPRHVTLAGWQRLVHSVVTTQEENEMSKMFYNCR